MLNFFKSLILLFFFINYLYAEDLKKCEWNNINGTPCAIIAKTSNTSEYSEPSVNKVIISKEKIDIINALDVNDLLKQIPGLDIFQSGKKGQTTSLFTRGSESNHTLVMINGIAINDQSVTDGLHDFGQDFIQGLQMIEIYKGSNGAHFGPSAIAGAINFITSVDYTNSYSLSGFNYKNNSANLNYTKITDNGWHLNFNSASNISETGSAKAGGSEYDGSENFQLNFNTQKWIKDNLKFKSTLYSRKTVTDYDASATDEVGYVSDNRMHTVQSELKHITKNTENSFIFHYNNYDRQYENSGFLDEYYSESFVVKSEIKNSFSEKVSFGYGSEYKYDWGSFENRGSYNASTKGHVKNFGLFGNVGYKINKDIILSIYGRSDDHNTTGVDQTYKINLLKTFKKFNFSLTNSTGLRNPTLYELYGSDNYGMRGNINLNPEKSKTNELSFSFDIFRGFNFKSTAYRTKIYDQIEANSEYSKHENQLVGINQEGIENEINFIRDSEILTVYNVFSKSRNAKDQAQLRRPDLAYGLNFLKKNIETPIGSINLNLNYKHTGQYIDWDGSKNTKQKITDIIDLSFTQNISNNIWSIKITNLLNERYEKPATYSQDGRQLRIGLKRLF